MSKSNTTQKSVSTISNSASNVNYRTVLTPKQKKFLIDYANFVQEYNVPKMAKAFGTTRQNVKKLQNERKEGKHV